MTKTYIMKEGSLHEKYDQLRTKIQFFGGGFGNGKTSAMIVLKVLKIARDYPGCNILVARSTYPKLNDTIRKTFIDFCPPEWIESFPMSKNSENTCTLKNGTKINFRYVSQRISTNDGGSTSNLLSATYDLIVVDQIEDPEITYKDFIDLLGRLRGDAVYRGDDPTMPRTGPRWLCLSSNPTRNWVYKRLIAPLKRYETTGYVSDELLCVRDSETDQPVLDADGKPQVMIALVEGSTYSNSHILAADFIQTLESSYRGQMRDRFLKGEWASYEGLVYPDFSEPTHVIRHDRMVLYMRDLILSRRVKLNWINGYDHGLSSPSCYLLAFVDQHGNISIVDGFYEKEASLEWQAKQIKDIRARYGAKPGAIRADPSIMRRTASSGKVVGKTITDLFYDEDPSLVFERGNNDIVNGIRKVRSYIQSYPHHVNPYTGERGAPYLYVSDQCQYLADEFSSYYWKTDSLGERDDTPVDKDDHSLDTLKYMLSDAPEPASIKRLQDVFPMYLTEWQERDSDDDPNAYRH